MLYNTPFLKLYSEWSRVCWSIASTSYFGTWLARQSECVEYSAVQTKQLFLIGTKS
jgi:hypothetical protein